MLSSELLLLFLFFGLSEAFKSAVISSASNISNASSNLLSQGFCFNISGEWQSHRNGMHLFVFNRAAESAKAQSAARAYSDHLALIRAYDGWKDAEA